MMKWVLRKLNILLVAVFLAFFPLGISASTNTWNFSNNTDYTFDSDLINVSSNSANLKAKDDWYDNDWSYRKKITIDYTKVLEDLTNYPMFISPSSDTDISTKALTNGDDLVFTNSDGETALSVDMVNNTGVYHNGTWTWYNDPRAIRHHGTYDKTYIGWINGLSGSVMVASYDHDSGASATSTLHASLQADDHDNPAFLVLPSGKIAAFYSQHGGTAYYRVSVNAEDISSWDTEQTFPTNSPGVRNFSYQNPFLLGGVIYNFWRGGDYKPTFSTSTEANLSSNTWSTAQEFLDTGTSDRPYVKYESDGDNTIFLAFTDGHPNEMPTNSIYFLKWNVETGDFTKADGTLVGNSNSLPIQVSDGEKIYDGTTNRAWIYDMAIDANEYPVLVYTVYTVPTTATDGIEYWYSRWNGSSWISNKITNAGGYIYSSEAYYAGGITLDHEDPDIVYLSQNDTSDNFILEKWVTADNGVSWTSNVISNVEDNYRPFVPWGHTDDELGLLWWSVGPGFYYTTYSSFYTNLRGWTIPEAASLAEAHVKIPSLSSSTATDVYVYYGNSSALDRNASTNAWDSNFLLVNHMNDVGPLKTVSQNSVDETLGFEQGNGPTSASGKAGNAQSFGGAGYIFIKPGINLAGLNSLTAEAWVKTSTNGFILSNWQSGSGSGIMMRFNSNVFQAYILLSDGSALGGNFTGLTPDGNWHYVVMTYDTTNGLKAYFDGVASATTYSSSLSSHATASTNLYFGSSPHLSTPYLNGLLDEVRVSNTNRSLKWIQTSYNNLSSPATFYSFGSEETIYSSAEPTIIPTSAVTFTSLSGFTESATKNGGEIKYQISNDNGTTWYWFNNGWSHTTGGYDEANIATEINDNISTFPSGSGQFLWRAYLSSNGLEQVQLSSISLTYSNNVAATNEDNESPRSGSRRRSNSLTSRVSTALPTLASSIAQVATSTASTTKPLFTENLYFGMTNDDVKKLQYRLAEEKVFYGPFTGYFGNLTFIAVKIYQIIHNITPVTGNVGPITRFELNK